MKKRQKIQFKTFQNATIGLLLVFSLMTLSIMALKSYFERQTTDEIKLASNQHPKFEVVYQSGNNTTKALLPLTVPNWNQNEYTKLTEINYEGKLDLKGFKNQIKDDLFIKVKAEVVGKNFNPNNLFQSQIKVYNQDLNNTAKINIQNDKIPIKIQVENMDLIPDNINNPQVELKTIYDIVDKDGNSFTGSQSQIKIPIKNVNKTT